MQAVGAVQGHVGQGQRDEFGAAERAGEPHEQHAGVAAGGHPGRPAARDQGQPVDQAANVLEEQRRPPGRWGGPDPADPGQGPADQFRPARRRQPGRGVQLDNRGHPPLPGPRGPRSRRPAVWWPARPPRGSPGPPHGHELGRITGQRLRGVIDRGRLDGGHRDHHRMLHIHPRTAADDRPAPPGRPPHPPPPSTPSARPAPHPLPRSSPRSPAVDRPSVPATERRSSTGRPSAWIFDRRGDGRRHSRDRQSGFVNVGWPHHVRFGWLHPWARLV